MKNKYFLLVLFLLCGIVFNVYTQTTETNCSNGIDDDGDGLIDCIDPDCLGSPDCASLNNGPVLNGVTEGTGTFFEVTNSDYLNVILASSTDITIFLSSVPQMISMNISRPATAPAPYEATLTITGLLPLTVYFKYDDSYHNLDSIITDVNGNYTWTQDLTAAHHVWIQPTRSTIFICDDATGCGCITVGTWNAGTKTCTLTTNVTGTIQIDSPGITLDGAGHSITGASTGYGVYVPYINNININNINVKNCVITHFTVGVQLQSSSNSTMTNNTASNNNYYGICLSSSSNDNTLIGNNTNSNSIGINLFSCSDNNLTGNVASANSYSGFFLASGSNNTLVNNTVSNNSGFGIVIQSNSNITLTNNNASHNTQDGIQITEGSNHNITGNTASFNTYNGIRLNMISNGNIDNNTANSNNIGLCLYYDSGNNFMGNNISNSVEYGIFIQTCQNNTIGGTGAQQSNTITNSGISGIYLIASNGIKISGNSIYNNPIAIINIGSNNNKAAPVITSFDGAIVIGTSDPNDTIEIFGSTGNEIANEYLTTVTADANGDWTANVSTSYYGVVATATDGSNNTSSLSPYYAIPQQPGSTCENAVIVEVAETCNPQTYQMNGISKWLSFVATDSVANILITKSQQFPNADYTEATLYSGNCQSLSLIQTSVVTNDSIYIKETNMIVGQTYYLEVIQQTSEVGYFDMCLLEDNALICVEWVDAMNNCNTDFQVWEVGNYYEFHIYICLGTTVLFSAGNAPKYGDLYWCTSSCSLNGSLAPLCGSGITSSCTYSATGVYTIQVSYDANCSDPLPGTVFVHVSCVHACCSPDVEASNNGPVCEGTTLSLSSSGGASYEWTGPGGFYSTQQNPTRPNVTMSMAGTYTVIVTGMNGCTASATTFVEVNESPEIEIIVNSDETCVDACDGSLTASVYYWNSGWTTFWSWTDEFGQTQTSGNNPPMPFDNLCPNTYTFTATNPENNCTSFESYTVEEGSVSVIISVLPNGITPACIGQSNGSISVNVNPLGGYPGCVHYHWSHNYYLDSPNATGLAAGTYTVTACCDGCCQSLTIEVPNYELPEHTLNLQDATPCCDGRVVIWSSADLDYLWDYQDSDEHGIYDLCAGDYTVTVTDNSNSCVYVQTFTVNLLPVPSQLTPNCGDLIINQPGTTYTIDQNSVACGNIIVMSPLVISNCTVEFTHNAQIIVYPTGSLLVDNATLTNFCDQTMWPGIVSFVLNSSLSKASIRVRYGIIENAYIAINAVGNVYLYTVNSMYRNNKFDIVLAATSDNHQIYGNTFWTTIPVLFGYNNASVSVLPDMYNIPSVSQPFCYADRHMVLFNNTQTVNLFGNSFANAQLNSSTGQYLPPTNITDRGTGIYNELTTVIIDDFGTTPSRFVGLGIAIRNRGLMKVSHSDFNYNNRGIHSFGSSSGIWAEDNDFIVSNNGNLYTPATVPCGILLENSNYYKVNFNRFKYGFIGTANVNTGAGSTPIWKNTFQNLYVGSLGNGGSDVRFNCNTYINNSNPAYYQSSIPVGGDMMVYIGSVNTNQSHYSSPTMSTMNDVDNTLCSQINFLKFHNHTSTPYEYWSCQNTDNTYIEPCAQKPYTTAGVVNNDIFHWDLSDFLTEFPTRCPDDYDNLTKSFASSFMYADSLKAVKEYDQNVLQSLIDNGNTDYFLQKIAVLAPNNYTKFYNELMSASPYLSDTVLISFMTHPINKPAHKKDVVIANSPLPYSVRPYIDQMNVNQNFKNQMWAAQNGAPNARVQLENEIDWASGRRQTEISSLAVKSIIDSTHMQTDSLITYLGNSDILEDRTTRYSLLVNMGDYPSAQTELSVINGLTFDLPVEKQQQYNDFKDVSEIFLSTLVNDSIADSLILSNEAFLQSIALTDFHVAQSDAKALLEKGGIQQEYEIFLPDGSEERMMQFSKQGNNNNASDYFTVFPNPSEGNITISYSMPETSRYELRMISQDGKVLNSWVIYDQEGVIKINCNTCISGQYTLTLYENEKALCSEKVQIIR